MGGFATTNCLVESYMPCSRVEFYCEIVWIKCFNKLQNKLHLPTTIW